MSEPSPKPKPSKFLRRSLIVLTIAGGLFLLVVGAARVLLTPRYLTPIVTSVCERYLNAAVSFDTIDVRLFEHFPYVSLKIRKAEIVSHVFTTPGDSMRRETPIEADTLAQVQGLDLSINAWALLAGTFDLRGVQIDDARMTAHVASDGRANWEIYQTAPTDDDDQAIDLDFNLQKLVIQNGIRVVYQDYQEMMGAQIRFDHCELQGRFSMDLSEIDLRKLTLRQGEIDWLLEGKQSGFQLESFDWTKQGHRPKEHYQISALAREFVWEDQRWIGLTTLGGQIIFENREQLLFGFQDVTARLEDRIDLRVGGQLGLSAEKVLTELELRGDSLRMSDLLAMIPAEMMPEGVRLATDGVVNLQISTHGSYVFETEAMPQVGLGIEIPQTRLECDFEGEHYQIDTLALDAALWYDAQRPDSCRAAVDRFHFVGMGAACEARQVRVDELMGDPLISGKIRGNLALGKIETYWLPRLVEILPELQGTHLKGIVGWSGEGSFRQSQLALGNLLALNLQGTLWADSVRAKLPAYEADVAAGGLRANLGLGASRSDSIVGRGIQALGAGFSVDTLRVLIGDEVMVAGRKLRMEVRTATANLDPSASKTIHPARGEFHSDRLRVRMVSPEGDSLRLLTRRAGGSFSLTPAPGRRDVPRIRIDLNASRLALREADSRYSIDDAGARFDATFYERDVAQERRRNQRLDSLQILYPGIPRDSLQAYARSQRGDTAHEGDLDFALKDDYMSGLLRQWQVTGSIHGADGQIVTPYFPLPTTLYRINMSFSTDEVHLHSAYLKAGQSEFHFAGNVAGIRRALLGGGRLRGNLMIDADTLNLNELIRGVNAGMDLMAMGGVGEVESDAHLQQRIMQSADTANASSLVMIPGNIDMTVDLEARNSSYAHLAMDTVIGQLVLRDRVLQLANLDIRTNAGNVDLSGIYATPSTDDITLGLDLDMRQIEVAELIRLFPSFDTLMPMLRAFSGQVDCQFAATGRLDQQMNLLFPSLNAACNLSGQNLVLMDGETFSTISRKLMFRNKKHNMIDHISAEILVRDSQIEIFPFLVELDRYRAAISGVHKLDMTFNYHISVLKSPLPFRLGIDITGNEDRFKYRLTGARYKSANLPSRVEAIEQTRVNLRDYIHGVFERTEQIQPRRITPETQSPTEMLPPPESTVGILPQL